MIVSVVFLREKKASVCDPSESGHTNTVMEAEGEQLSMLSS